MSDLIDTTEMYLRVLYELAEQGIPPMRARIAERLLQASPTVSQTVARMERDGLVTLDRDRRVQLTPEGEATGRRVMRRHRLAERMLVDTLGIPLADAHDEACRWEHVLSEDVERRLFEFLGRPTHSPYGNPIPGLSEIADVAEEPFEAGVEPLGDRTGGTRLALITESFQASHEQLAGMLRAGVVPGADISVAHAGGILVVDGPDGSVNLGPEAAEGLWTARP